MSVWWTITEHERLQIPVTQNEQSEIPCSIVRFALTCSGDGSGGYVGTQRIYCAPRYSELYWVYNSSFIGCNAAPTTFYCGPQFTTWETCSRFTLQYPIIATTAYQQGWQSDPDMSQPHFIYLGRNTDVSDAFGNGPYIFWPTNTNTLVYTAWIEMHAYLRPPIWQRVAQSRPMSMPKH